ncbi:MAG: hypothetical protein ABDH66_06650 [Bacteroidia bacterium]
MRRLLIGAFLLLIIILASVWTFNQFVRVPRRPSLWQNVPKGYLLIAYTPSFSQMWRHLQRNPFVKSLSETPRFSAAFTIAHQWDSLIHATEDIRRWLTGHALLVAIYPEGTLYLIDAPFLEEIGDWRGEMQKIAEKNKWNVEVIEYGGYSLWRFGQKYLVPAGKILAFSDSPKILAQFLSGENVALIPPDWGNAIIEGQGTWLILTNGKGIYQLFSHPLLAYLSEIDTIQAEIRLDEEGLKIQGSATQALGIWSYLSPSPPQLADLCPPSTSAFAAFKISNPVRFFNTFIRPRYQAEITQAEKSLRISFSDDFFSQLTGESGFIQGEEPYLIYRLQQGHPFPPLPQEKVTNYHSYVIKRIRAGGLFRWLYGEPFAKWTTPYTVQVGEWVLFAQNPAPLYSWLNALINRQSLYNRADFSLEVPTRAAAYAYLDASRASWIKTWAPPQSIARWQKDLSPFSAFHIAVYKEDSLKLRISIHGMWRNKEENPLSVDSLLPPTLNPIPVIKDTTRDGIQEEYYPNGVVKRRFTLMDGQMEGEYTEYHPNGIIKVRGFYEQGQKVGKWTYFNSKGEKLREETWSSENEPISTPSAP